MKNESEDSWSIMIQKLEEINKEAERLNWEELNDEAIDVYSDSNSKDTKEVFLNNYQYLFRLRERVRNWIEPRKFDEIRDIKMDLPKRPQVEFFMVMNYSYKSFVWAKQNGFIDHLNNNYYLVEKEELEPRMRASFQKRAIVE